MGSRVMKIFLNLRARLLLATALLLSPLQAMDEELVDLTADSEASTGHPPKIKLVQKEREKFNKEDPETQFDLGLRYKNGEGVGKDENQALKYFQSAADKGHARAQNYLGSCYQKGKGVEKDEAKAFQLYTLAAEQGHAGAQDRLNTYEKGEGVKKDKKEGNHYSKLVTDQGRKKAQSASSLYDLGIDPYLAVQHLRLGAEQGDLESRYKLGLSHELGRGLEKKDEMEAFKNYKLAADRGHIKSQYKVGKCYAKGRGVKKDEKIALKYYNLAAAHGYKKAQKKVPKAAKRIVN
jgi:hypothetical protein